MYRRKSFGYIALMAFLLLSLPSSAMSAPVLTHPTGTVVSPIEQTTVVEEHLIPDFRKITGTSVGELRVTDGSATEYFRCPLATLTGELVKNSGTEIEANITSLTFGGTAGGDWCTGGFPFGSATRITTAFEEGGVKKGLPWCFRATSGMASDEFQIRGGLCSEAARDVALKLDESGCSYKRAANMPVKGSIRTDAGSPEDTIITISEQKFEKYAGMFCLSTLAISVSLTLETDKGTAEPFYLS